jgi:hypothetical protein
MPGNNAMSLQHSPEGDINRKILQAIAGAIRSIETVTGTIVQFDIGKVDAVLLNAALKNLWSILESNGYTIDIDTNRLRSMHMGNKARGGQNDSRRIIRQKA